MFSNSEFVINNFVFTSISHIQSYFFLEANLNSN